MLNQTVYPYGAAPFVDWSIARSTIVGLDPAGELFTMNGTAGAVTTGVTGGVQVAAGFTLTCVLQADGSVRCLDIPSWNSATDLGVVPGIGTAIAVAAGGAHGCALRADDRVFCWHEDNLTTPSEVTFP
jgi:hypothetical protein